MGKTPQAFVAAPTVRPYGYGLLSVVEMPVSNDPHVLNGVQYEPLLCGTAKLTRDECNAPTGTVVPDKAADEGVPLVTSEPFTVYAGFDCRIVGRSDEAEIMQRAEDALRLGEQRAVELAYWTGSMGNRPFLADAGTPVLNPTGTTVTPVSIVAGLGLLEGRLRNRYAGVGAIHAPASLAAGMKAHGLVERVGPRLETVTGTPVAFGGGYEVNTGPGAQVAPAGTRWMYATGQVAIWRSEVFVNPDSLASALNRRTNQVHLLAERTYVVAHECVTAAVLVDYDSGFEGVA